MTRYPGLTVLVTLVSSTLVLSYINRIVERPFVHLQRGWRTDPFINNIYLTVITMTTVGFGDYVPVTTFGKIVTLGTALWGGFIITLLIVSVNGKKSILKVSLIFIKANPNSNSDFITFSRQQSLI